jgi:hypothetical protein
MAANPITAAAGINPANFRIPVINGRPDLEFAKALDKVSPQAQAKAKTTATDFEAMFLNSMFAQMTSGLKGEGPFGDTPGTGVWLTFGEKDDERTRATARRKVARSRRSRRRRGTPARR